MRLLIFIVAMFMNTFAFADTISIVVPYTAGGVIDQNARVLERALTKRIPEHNFIVEYKIGAGGMLAANAVAKNNSKETQLLIHSSAFVTNLFNKNSSYSISDYAPVAILGQAPQVLIANKSNEINSWQKLMSTNKPLFFGTGGIGTAMWLSGEVFKDSTGKDMTPVHYKGESAALADILTNNVNVMWLSVSTATAFSKSDKINFIAVTGTQRSDRLPDVPTFRELGFKGFDRSTNWCVVMANPTADAKLIKQIQNAIKDSLNDSVDIEAFRIAGTEPDKKSLFDVTKFLNEEYNRIKRLPAVNDLN